MKISAKTFRKYISTAATWTVLSIFASQCFAQSSVNESALNKKYLETINSLYYYIQQNYVEEVDPKTLYEGALRGMLESLKDPYSVYMDKSEWRNLSDTTTGNFGGVGLSITKPSSNSTEKPAYVEVVQPIEDTPGYRAGIAAGDLIIKIDGVDTAPLTMDEVLGKLRGKVGESVTVTIRRKKAEFEKTLVRALIETPSVKFGLIGETCIGYVRLTEFAANTSARFQEAIDYFEQNGGAAIIIDLRNNGGGLLKSAVEIADKLIDDGRIVETKSRISYENSVYNATKRATSVKKEYPVVVLTNKGSASASEILAGALKDSKRAYLVGETTFGKGSVQVPSALWGNDGFKITVAKYYTPSDVNIDKVGIRPDKEVLFPEFSDEEMEAWKNLIESEKISDYVDEHPDMDETDIRLYAERLRREYRLEDRYLRKMVRNEVEKHLPSRLFDLDYDIQLNEAIRVIQENWPHFKSLVNETLTVKQQLEQNVAENSGSAE